MISHYAAAVTAPNAVFMGRILNANAAVVDSPWERGVKNIKRTAPGRLALQRQSHRHASPAAFFYARRGEENTFKPTSATDHPPQPAAVLAPHYQVQ